MKLSGSSTRQRPAIGPSSGSLQ